MTREEAIRHLDILRVFDAPALSEAIKMAISALREQEERSKGCEYCKGARTIYCEMSASGKVDDTHDFVSEWYGDVTICPLCGRRLEEHDG